MDSNFQLPTDLWLLVFTFATTFEQSLRYKVVSKFFYQSVLDGQKFFRNMLRQRVWVVGDNSCPFIRCHPIRGFEWQIPSENLHLVDGGGDLDHLRQTAKTVTLFRTLHDRAHFNISRYPKVKRIRCVASNFDWLHEEALNHVEEFSLISVDGGNDLMQVPLKVVSKTTALECVDGQQHTCFMLDARFNFSRRTMLLQFGSALVSFQGDIMSVIEWDHLFDAQFWPLLKNINYIFVKSNSCISCTHRLLNTRKLTTLALQVSDDVLQGEPDVWFEDDVRYRGDRVELLIFRLDVDFCDNDILQVEVEMYWRPKLSVFAKEVIFQVVREQSSRADMYMDFSDAPELYESSSNDECSDDMLHMLTEKDGGCM